MPTKTESAPASAQTKTAKPISPTKIIVISVVAGLLAGLLGAFLYLQIAAHSSKPFSTGLSKKEIISQDNAIIDVAKKASPSVVSIVSSSTATNFLGQSQQQQGAGTGIIVKDNGLILTNKHVVTGGQSFTVIDNNGKQYQNAKVVATDPTNDIAFLKVDASGLTPATLGDSAQAEVGETVIAIGNALGQFQNSVTTGIISGKGRPITAGDQGSSSGSESLQNLLQTDAAINPGNSGGPLLDISGQVIGINTAVSGEGQNIGFAIPINEAKNDLASLDSTGKIVKPYLGVRYVSITPALAKANGLPADHGAFVQGTGSVIGGSPAAQAGLEQGDIITKVNDTEVNANNQLTSVVGQFKPGETVTLTVVRQGKTITLKAKLGEAPSQ